MNREKKNHCVNSFENIFTESKHVNKMPISSELQNLSKFPIRFNSRKHYFFFLHFENRFHVVYKNIFAIQRKKKSTKWFPHVRFNGVAKELFPTASFAYVFFSTIVIKNF